MSIIERAQADGLAKREMKRQQDMRELAAFSLAQAQAERLVTPQELAAEASAHEAWAESQKKFPMVRLPTTGLAGHMH